MHGAIFLPGAECNCVKLALENGTISKYHHLYLIEKDKLLAKLIKIQARRFPNADLHIGEAHELEIKDRIDFAFLDFIGSMDDRLYDWIRDQLIPSLIPPFRVSFCFNYAWRPDIPLLKRKCAQYKQSRKLFDTSLNYPCDGDYRIGTYFTIFEELFDELKIRFVPYANKAYFRYQDNQNPMLLFTLESTALTKVLRRKPVVTEPKLQKGTDMKPKPSFDLPTLLAAYPAALRDFDKMRGWKRSLTLYTRNMAEIKGGEPERHKRVVKARLTRLGYDTSPI